MSDLSYNESPFGMELDTPPKKPKENRDKYDTHNKYVLALLDGLIDHAKDIRDELSKEIEKLKSTQ